MTALWIALGVLATVVVVVVFSYNRFVRQRQYIDNSWSTIDSELQRRYDLVPNLVRAVQGYVDHEQTTLEAVTRARSTAMASTGEPDEQARDEKLLVTHLQQLLALRESYPELAASHQFVELQRQLVVTEDRLQAARRIYNENVRSYNNRVDSVPSMLVARVGGFDRAAYFEVESAATEVPAVA